MQQRPFASRPISNLTHSSTSSTARAVPSPAIPNRVISNNPVQNKAVVNKSGNRSATSPSSSSSKEELTRIFNSAILSTRSKAKRNFSAELIALTESTSFKAILNAVQQVARVQGISDRQAAEQVIETFRKMDDLWSEYTVCEGLDKIRKPQRSTK